MGNECFAHEKNEDCLICKICGECKISLDQNDVCSDCRDHNNDGY